MEIDFSRGIFRGKLFRRRRFIGPIFDKKKVRVNCVKQFIADCFCYASDCANHPHADRTKTEAESPVTTEDALRFAGFTESADDNRCYWAEDDLRELSKFCNSRGKNKKKLVSIIKDKLLKFIAFPNGHIPS